MKREFCKQSTGPGRLAVLCLIGVLSIGSGINHAWAGEAYTWTDENGVMHFSDVPPENVSSDTIQIEEAYRPGSSGAYAETEDAAPAASAEAESPVPESVASVAEQRREQIAEDRAAKKAEQEELAALCPRYETLLEQLEPARRVFYTNEQGEEVRMDDEERVARVAEAKDFIAKNCR